MMMDTLMKLILVEDDNMLKIMIGSDDDGYVDEVDTC